SYSSGPLTPRNYSQGSSRNAECSNCKHLRGKISLVKATMEMHMHPEQHTVNSVALFHEVLNEMEKLNLEYELRMKCKDMKKIYKYFKAKMPTPLENEVDIYVDALGIALEDGKFRTGEYISLVHDYFSELKARMDAFNPSQTPSYSNKNLENFMEWLKRSRPKLDDFLKRYGKSQNPKSGQTTKVEQTGDESNGVNTPYAKNKKAERNKGNKGKKGKSKK
ncbi:hypothetical protein Tco_1497594, partial [Tanacetum coccineum]